MRINASIDSISSVFFQDIIVTNTSNRFIKSRGFRKPGLQSPVVLSLDQSIVIIVGSFAVFTLSTTLKVFL
jgi:hypothetical protein